MTTYSKIFWILSIFFTLQVPLFASVQKEELKKIIQNIPSEDRKSLDDFLLRLLLRGFAYTLFGDKPISIECFDLENPKKAELWCTPFPHGYRTLEKYAPLFPQDKFIFLFYEDLEEDLCEITLINKKAFYQIVNQHKEKFAKIFGPKIQAEKLLHLLIQKRSLWNTPMKDRDDLIGILLGYGKTNAELFQKRTEITRVKGGLKKRRTIPSPGYSSTEEELKNLNASLESFSKEGKIPLQYIRLPGFVADHQHPETTNLRKKYKEQRKRITKKCAQGNVLQITLEQLYEQPMCR